MSTAQKPQSISEYMTRFHEQEKVKFAKVLRETDKIEKARIAKKLKSIKKARETAKTKNRYKTISGVYNLETTNCKNRSIELQTNGIDYRVVKKGYLKKLGPIDGDFHTFVFVSRDDAIALSNSALGDFAS